MVAGLGNQLLEFGNLLRGQVNIFIAAMEQVSTFDVCIVPVPEEAFEQCPVEIVLQV